MATLPAPPPEVIAARLASLATLQPGDIIVSETNPGTQYIGIVAGPAVVVEGIIRLACQLRIVEGKFQGLEGDTMTSAENLARWAGLRILRATEGLL